MSEAFIGDVVASANFQVFQGISTVLPQGRNTVIVHLHTVDEANFSNMIAVFCKNVIIPIFI